MADELEYQEGVVDPNTGIQKNEKFNRSLTGYMPGNDPPSYLRNAIPMSSSSRMPDFRVAASGVSTGMPVDTQYRTGYTTSQGDPMEFMAQQQSVMDRVGNAGVRLAGTTVTKFLSGLSAMAGAPFAVINQDIDWITNNTLTQVFDGLEEGLKEQLPIYKTRKYLNGNILDQMGTASFYADDVSDGVAFLLSAIIPGILSGGTGLIGSAGSKLGSLGSAGAKGYTSFIKGISPMLSSAMKAKALAQAASVGKKIEIGSLALLQTGFEASFEAKDTQTEIESSLKSMRSAALAKQFRNEELTPEEARQAYMTDETIKSIAAEGAVGAYWSNMAAIAIPNFFEQKMFFGSFKAGRKAIMEATGQTIKPLTTAAKFGIFVRQSGMSMLREGAYEENIQSAIQHYEKMKAEDYANGLDTPDRVPALLRNMASNFFTDEGQKAIVLGALIGLIPGGVGGLRESVAENKSARALQNLLNNNRFYKMGSLQNFYTYQTNPETGVKEVVMEADKYGVLRPKVDIDKVKAGGLQMLSVMQRVQALTEAAALGDYTTFKMLRKQELANAILPFLENGSLEEALKEIELAAEADTNDINQSIKDYREDGTPVTAKELAAEYKESAKEFAAFYNEVSNQYAGVEWFGASKEAGAFRDKLMNAQYNTMVGISTLQEASLSLEESRDRLMEQKRVLATDPDYQMFEVIDSQIDKLTAQIEFVDSLKAAMGSRVDRAVSAKKQALDELDAAYVETFDSLPTEVAEDARSVYLHNREQLEFEIALLEEEEEDSAKEIAEEEAALGRMRENIFKDKQEMAESLKALGITVPTSIEATPKKVTNDTPFDHGIRNVYSQMAQIEKALTNLRKNFDVLADTKAQKAEFARSMADTEKRTKLQEAVARVEKSKQKDEEKKKAAVNVAANKAKENSSRSTNDDGSKPNTTETPLTPQETLVLQQFSEDGVDVIDNGIGEFLSNNPTENTDLSQIIHGLTFPALTTTLLTPRENETEWAKKSRHAKLAFAKFMEEAGGANKLQGQKIMFRVYMFPAEGETTAQAKERFAAIKLRATKNAMTAEDYNALSISASVIDSATNQYVKVPAYDNAAESVELKDVLFIRSMEAAKTKLDKQNLNVTEAEAEKALGELFNFRQEIIGNSLNGMTVYTTIYKTGHGTLNRKDERYQPYEPVNVANANLIGFDITKAELFVGVANTSALNIANGEPLIMSSDTEMVPFSNSNALGGVYMKIKDAKGHTFPLRMVSTKMSEDTATLVYHLMALRFNGLTHQFMLKNFTDEEITALSEKWSNSYGAEKASKVLMPSLLYVLKNVQVGEGNETNIGDVLNLLICEGPITDHYDGYDALVDKKMSTRKDSETSGAFVLHYGKDGVMNLQDVALYENNKLAFVEWAVANKNNRVAKNIDSEKWNTAYKGLTILGRELKEDTYTQYVLGAPSNGGAAIVQTDSRRGLISPSIYVNMDGLQTSIPVAASTTPKAGATTPVAGSNKPNLPAWSTMGDAVLPNGAINEDKYVVEALGSKEYFENLANNPAAMKEFIDSGRKIVQLKFYKTRGYMAAEMAQTSITPQGIVFKLINTESEMTTMKDLATDNPTAFSILAPKNAAAPAAPAVQPTQPVALVEPVAPVAGTVTTPPAAPVISGTESSAIAELEALKEEAKNVALEDTLAFEQKLFETLDRAEYDKIIENEDPAYFEEVERQVNIWYSPEQITEMDDAGRANVVSKIVLPLFIQNKINELQQQPSTAPQRRSNAVRGNRPTGTPRLAQGRLERMPKANTERSKKWLRKVLGDSVPIEVVEGLIQHVDEGGNIAHAWGETTLHSIILSDLAAEGTEYHEAYHRVSLLYLPPDLRNAIYQEAREKYGLKNYTNRQVEEFLAEKFREFMMTQRDLKMPRKIEHWFKRLMAIIKSFFNIKPRSIDALFYKIDTGGFRKAKPSAVNIKRFGDTSYARELIPLTEDGMRNVGVNIARAILFEHNIRTPEDLRKLTSIFAPQSRNAPDSVLSWLAEEKEQLIADGLPEKAELMDYIGENYELFEDFIRPFFAKLGKYGEEEMSDEDNERAVIDVKNHNKDDFDTSAKDSSSFASKMTLLHIPKMFIDENTNERLIEYNKETGLIEYMPFDIVWRQVLGVAGKSKGIQEMIESLYKASATKPHLDQVATILKHDLNIHERITFFNNIHKHSYEFLNMRVNKEGDEVSLIISDAETQTAAFGVVEQWREEFLLKDIYTKREPLSTINKDIAKQLSLEYNTLEKLIKASSTSNNNDFNKAIRRTKSLLSKVGIDVTTKDIQDYSKGKYGGATSTSVSPKMHQLKLFILDDMRNIFQMHNGKGEFLPNFFTKTALSILYTGKKDVNDNPIFKNEKFVRDLAAVHVENSTDIQTDIILGERGKNKYKYQDGSYLTDAFDRINSNIEYVKALQGTIYSSSSFVLKSLLENEKLRGKMRLRYINTMSQDDAMYAESYQSFGSIEDYIAKAALLLKGFLISPTLADTKVCAVIDGAQMPDLELNIDGDQLKPSGSLVRIFVGYLESEIARIQDERSLYFEPNGKLKEELDGRAAPDKQIEFYHYQIDEATGEKDYTKGNAFRLNGFFSGLNGYLKEDGSLNGGAVDIMASYLPAALQQQADNSIQHMLDLGIIERFFDNDTKEYKLRNVGLPQEFFMSKSLVAVEATEEQKIRQLAYQIEMRHKLSYIEFTKLFSMDPAYYKNDADLIKRMALLRSTGATKPMMTPEEFAEAGLDNYNEELRVLIVDDIRRTSRIFDLLKAKSALILYNKPVEELNEEELAAVEKKISIFINAINTDGQFLITPQRHREIQIEQGKWLDPEYQKAYELHVSGKKRADLTEEEYRLVSKWKMIPNKGVLFAADLKDGRSVPIGFKMSEAPISRITYEGTMMVAVLDFMEEMGADVFAFHSGVKVGARNVLSLFDQEGEWNIEEADKAKRPEKKEQSVFKINKSNWRKQIELPEHTTASSDVATQVLKMVMNNMQMNENVYSVAGIDGLLNGQEWVDIYNKVRGVLAKNAYSRYSNELGIFKRSQKKALEQAKLAKMLFRAAEVGNASEGLKMTLRLREDTKTMYPIDSTSDRNFVFNTLMSYISKKVIKLEMPGMPLIQVSSFGIKDTNVMQDLRLLQEPDGPLVAECAVPIELFKSIIPKQLKTFAQQEAWLKAHPEVYEGVMYRVPTQYLSSVMIFKPVKFLPNSAGETIFVPEEVMVMSGGDFDIDKLYMFQKNYFLGKDGKPREHKFFHFDKQSPASMKAIWESDIKDIVKDALKEIAQISEELDMLNASMEEEEYSTEDISIKSLKRRKGDLQQVIRKFGETEEEFIKKASKRDIYSFNSNFANQNLLVDLFTSVLKSPASFNDSMSTIDGQTGVFKDDSKDIMSLYGEDVEKNREDYSSLWKQSTIKVQFTTGQGVGIGITALAISDHIMSHLNGLYANENIGVGNALDGKTSFGDTFDVDGRAITEMLSGMLSSFIDIAKDPYIFNLNVNDTTLNVAIALYRAGAGRWTHYFLSQPGVRTLATRGNSSTQGLSIHEYNSYSQIITEYSNEVDDILNGMTEDERTNFKVSYPDGIQTEKFSPEHYTIERLRANIKIYTKYKALIKRGVVLDYKSRVKAMKMLHEQIELLKQYHVFDVAGQKLNDQTMAVRIDTRKHGSSPAALSLFLRNMKKLRADSYWEGFKEKIDGTFLSPLVEHGLYYMDDALSQVTLYASHAFTTAIDDVLTLANKTTTRDERLVKRISDALMTYVAHKFLTQRYFSEDGVLGTTPSMLLYGTNEITEKSVESAKESFVNSLAGRFNRLKSDPEFMDNPLVKSLNFVSGGILPNLVLEPNAVIRRRLKAEGDEKSILQSQFRQLFRTPKSRNFMESLVVLSMLQTGHNNNLFSLSDIIPPDVLDEIGFTDFLEKELVEANENPFLYADAVRMVFENEYDNNDLVPRMPRSNGRIHSEDKIGLKYPFKKGNKEETYLVASAVKIPYNSKLRRGSKQIGNKSINVFAPFIKSSTPGYGIIMYKFMGVDKEGDKGNAIYVAAPRRSFKRKGLSALSYLQTNDPRLDYFVRSGYVLLTSLKASTEAQRIEMANSMGMAVNVTLNDLLTYNVKDNPNEVSFEEISAGLRVGANEQLVQTTTIVDVSTFKDNKELKSYIKMHGLFKDISYDHIVEFFDGLDYTEIKAYVPNYKDRPKHLKERFIAYLNSRGYKYSDKVINDAFNLSNRRFLPLVSALFSNNKALSLTIYVTNTTKALIDRAMDPKSTTFKNGRWRMKVVAGAQLGADMSGLDAAIASDYETGGTAAYKFMQSTGKGKHTPNAKLAELYGLTEGELTVRETHEGKYDDYYSHRTVKNAQDADGTIWFGDPSSRGGRLTLSAQAQAGKKIKPLVNPETAQQIADWIVENDIHILNVAGNREFTNPGIYEKSYNMLVEAFKLLPTEETVAKEIGRGRTQSGNVVVKEMFTKEGVDYTGLQKYAEANNMIYSLRRGDTYKHYGNPFGENKKAKGVIIIVGSIEEAAQLYGDWLNPALGDKPLSDYGINDKRTLSQISPVQRKWIMEEIASGEHKGKKILYWKELFQPSHANVLDSLINGTELAQANETVEPAITEASVINPANIEALDANGNIKIGGEIKDAPADIKAAIKEGLEDNNFDIKC